MATCGGICGISISCPDGCGVVCTTDCTDCTQWCEPTTVRAFTEGAMIRIDRTTGDVRIGVGQPPEPPDSAMPRYYSDQEVLSVRFHDLPRASLAGLLAHHLGRTVRVTAGKEEERISGSAEAPVADIAAEYSLVLE